MNVIEQNIPRTMHHHNIVAKDKDRLEIANDTAEFFAKGGHITDIARGVGNFQLKTGPKYYASVATCNTTCNTTGNQARRAEKLG